MKAICFLTVRPNRLFFNFCENLALVNDNYKIYVCVDDNEHMVTCNENINIIKLDSMMCENLGFKSTVSWLNNKACSRDKALYFFCKINKSYEFVWFIEEDVLIPTSTTIQEIDEKYSTGDLLSRSNFIINDKFIDAGWYHWKLIYSQTNLPFPYAKSMICAIRVSNKLLECIENYADNYKNLFMNEVIFNTLALHNELEIKTPPELSGITYRRVWKKEEIKKTYLYHPIKNINTQWDFRNYLLNKC